jgi:CBS-domain-containing membrane protein
MSTERTPAPEAGLFELALRLVQSNAGTALVSGLGGGVAIFILASLSLSLERMLLIAPFGATCVLLFVLPQSPLARPRNVIGGHSLSAIAGLAVLHLLGTGAVACGLAVGLAIAAMQITDTVHPPAGGTPLVVLILGAGWSFLVLPILAGTIALVLLAYAYHRFVSGRTYPA